MKNNSQKEQNEKKKAALNEYREALKEVDYWAEKVKTIRRSDRYRSPSATVAPTTSGPSDPTSNALLDLEHTERNLTAARKAAQEVKDRVLSLIRMAPTADQRVLLMRHYIDGMSWEEAAEAAGKGRTWATNTHGTALLYIELQNDT